MSITKTKKGIDLSGLDDFNISDFLTGSPIQETDIPSDELQGKALEILLELIEEDPQQPRTHIDPDKLQEMADSIQAKRANGTIRGVKSPISVRHHPDQPGRYLINHGHRRYRAARLAGLKTIPAFIDNDHDDYDQVVENVQREGLSPLEIAHFVQKRLNAGDKKGDIAKALGKPASYISDHAVLIEMADCIRELYDDGRCEVIQALALLHRAYKKHTEQVEAFCRRAKGVVTASQVRAFVDTLKEPPAPVAKAAPPVNQEESHADDIGNSQQDLEQTEQPSQEHPIQGEKEEGELLSPVSLDTEPVIHELAQPILKEIVEPEQQITPYEPVQNGLAIHVRQEERPAVLLTDCESDYGFGWIKYEDTGDETEVDLTCLTLVALIKN